MKSPSRILPATLLLLAAASASAQTPQPPIELQVRISETVGGLTDAMTEGPARREEAADSLVLLNRTLLEALREHADDADLEVRLRTRRVLSDAVLRVRVLRVLAHVPRENELKLRGFRRAHPGLFSEVFSDDLDRRTQAVAQIATAEDPDALAEPLLIMCLGHPSEKMRAAAAFAATSGRYRSDAMVLKLLETARRHGFDSSHRFLHDDSEPSTGELAMTAIRQIGNPVAAGPLVGMLSESAHHFSYGMEVELAETIAATGELRVIPHLMDMLSNSRAYGQMEFEGVRITRAHCDGPLLALVYLTGQDPSRYGFVFVERYWEPIFGFADAEDREKAIERFRNWWDEHKDRPPYSEIEPIELTPQSAPGRQVRRQSATAATSAPTTAASTQPATQEDVELLRRELADFARLTVRGFGDERFENRQLAGEEMLATLEMMLEPLVARARDEDARKAVLEVLGRLVAEADAQSFLANLAADEHHEQLEKALAFRREHPEVFEDLFSLNWHQRARSLERIARLNDTKALAEPLLIQNMSHSSEPVVRAALISCATGRYHSDEMVDELLRVALENTEDRDRGWYNPSDMPLSVAAVRAIERIGSRRAAPTLMALLKQALSEHDHQFSAQLVRTIGETGETNLLPILIKGLDGTQVRSTQSTSNDGEEIRLTIAESDFYLMAALLLTDQKPGDYGFIYLSSYHGEQERGFGFADEKQREEAVKKFKDWWEEHSGRAPYDDLKPPPIPQPEQKDPSPDQRILTIPGVLRRGAGR